MKKFDVIIEAVRYKDGRIDCVRAYERRGPTYSDRILLDRNALIERLKGGKHLATGQRKEYLAGTFDVGKPVKLSGADGQQIVSTLSHADHDELEGVPSF